MPLKTQDALMTMCKLPVHWEQIRLALAILKVEERNYPLNFFAV